MSYCKLCIYAHSKFPTLHHEYLSSREVPFRALSCCPNVLVANWSKLRFNMGLNTTKPFLNSDIFTRQRVSSPHRHYKKTPRFGPTNITWPTDERDVTKSGFLSFSFPSSYLSRLAIRIRNPQAMKMSFTFSGKFILHQDTFMYV